MRVEFAKSLASVSAQQWNALWHSDYPFTRYPFLDALERSGCTNASSGWQAQHCLVYEAQQLIAVMPLYLKTHSYGEYVFDWSWANAYHENGFAYYPKLLNGIPFTPATGPRWAIDDTLPSAQQTEVLQLMLGAIAEQIQRFGYSSFHSLFAQADQRQQALKQKTLTLHARVDCQFHWFNQNYRSFTEFLATFNARKRKNVNRERRKVSEQNIQVQMLSGNELNSEDWRQFYLLYQRTYQKRSGHNGYLNEVFFQLLGQNLASNVVMAKAERDGEWLAAALYLRDEFTLYGRYWGAVEEFDALHFECCYYQGIEYAIAHNLLRFDPGAQGEHKIARGFTPVLTGSLHHIAHPGFEHAIADFLQREQSHVRHYCQTAREDLPFRDGITNIESDCLLGTNSEHQTL